MAARPNEHWLDPRARSPPDPEGATLRVRTAIKVRRMHAKREVIDDVTHLTTAAPTELLAELGTGPADDD